MKKASLNLSIQAIVIVVIAFVVLGLGLGFVKSTFKDITGTTKDVQSKIKEQILEDMRTSGKKLSVSQEVHLERGEETTENIGIVNTGTGTGNFGVDLKISQGKRPDGSTETDPTVLNDEISFFFDMSVDKILGATDGDVIPITISASRSASGNYLGKVTVYTGEAPDCLSAGDAGCTIYDTRSFFVKVS
tara:strand:+ start:201 stop:770 length:570 start_codon:yes stop_codon:yes gene_type:complete